MYTKDQTIQAEWLAIPSIVVDPVPAVLAAEVTKTIRHINNNKAPGSDDLSIELIKAIDDDSKMMAQLKHLCNQIITEGKWSAEFRGSIYVPIYKRGEKMDCKNYRTIALIPHASKITLGIIHQRMLSYYGQELSETQSGFRKDNGIRDQMMNMRLICEKQNEHNKNEYCCFIDCCKAFDCVDFELMLSFGIQKYIVECLEDIYQNQTAEVETVVGRTEPLSMQRGVRQGCPLSPMLFNMTRHSQFDNSDLFNPHVFECSQDCLSRHKLLHGPDASVLTDRQHISLSSGVQLKCDRHVTHSKLCPPISVMYVPNEQLSNEQCMFVGTVLCLNIQQRMDSL